MYQAQVRTYDDPDQMSEAMQPFAPGVRVEGIERGAFRTRVVGAIVGDLALFSVRGSPMRARIDAASEDLYFHVPFAAPFDAVEDDVTLEVTVDHGYIKPPDLPLDCRKHAASDVLVFSGPQRLLRRWTRETGIHDDPWRPPLPRLLSLRSLSGAALRRYASFLWAEAQRASPLVRSPLVAEEMSRGLLSAMLLAAQGEPAPPAPAARAREQVRRARDFIAANLDRPLTLGDIAAAAGANPRTLQRRFRNECGLSVMGLVREERLRAVHADLAAADPDSASVTYVAVRYGFAHLGRFAADYERRFGELPSHTLRG